MTRRLRVLLPVALLLAGVRWTEAQAPKITPAGDPSVRADSIYKLAVDPAAYPGESSRFLLDDGVVRLEADGRGTKTYRQIVQILRSDAVEGYQEMRFSYAPKHERFSLNWIHVVLPDGTVISDKPAQVQESDVPAQMGDAVYSDRKVIRVSLSGVRAGTIVDFSTTTEELKPFLEGDSYFQWGVSTGLAVARSRYIVDVPATLLLHLREENLTFKRQERVANGRRTMIWAATDLPKLKAEAFAADSNGVYMSVVFSLPMTWAGIGKWYAGNAAGRYTLDAAAEAKLVDIVRTARTLDDSLRAVHRFVAQEVRYVSIALGLGGYQPRTPAEVVGTGFGDCKDKATIFVAMLNRMGITAHPVILNSTGGVARDVPSIEQFDHVIAAYKLPGSEGWHFADLTAEFTPLGELPFGPQGEFGIIVKPDGSVEEVTLPLSPISENLSQVTLTGSISADGTFDGEFVEVGRGNAQYDLRSTFADPPDSTGQARFADQVAASWFVGAQGRDLRIFNGRDLQAVPEVRVRIVGGKAAQLAGSTVILTNPLATMSRFVAAARELDAQPRRLFPIDAMKIFGFRETRVDVRMTLPEGWSAQLPASVDASGPFGTYVSAYSQVGRELRITRLVRGHTGILPPDRVGNLAAWMREVGRDDATVIVIKKPEN